MDYMFAIGVFVVTQLVIIVLFYDRVIKPFLVVTQRLDINTSKTLCTATEEIKKLAERLDTMQVICNEHQHLEHLHCKTTQQTIDEILKELKGVEKDLYTHKKQAHEMWKIVERYGDELKMHHEQLNDLYASIESVVRETRSTRNESSHKQ